MNLHENARAHKKKSQRRIVDLMLLVMGLGIENESAASFDYAMVSYRESEGSIRVNTAIFNHSDIALSLKGGLSPSCRYSCSRVYGCSSIGSGHTYCLSQHQFQLIPTVRNGR